MSDSDIDELVKYAKTIIEYRGLKGLVEFNYYPSACGCLGPDKGYTMCPCKLNSQLSQHKVQVIAKINETVALNIMRQRLIAALRG